MCAALGKRAHGGISILFPAPALFRSQTGLVGVCSPTCLTQPEHSRSSHTLQSQQHSPPFRAKRPWTWVQRSVGRDSQGPTGPEQGLQRASRNSLWDSSLGCLNSLPLGKGDGYRRAQQGPLKEGSRVATLVGWGQWWQALGWRKRLWVRALALRECVLLGAFGRGGWLHQTLWL